MTRSAPPWRTPIGPARHCRGGQREDPAPVTHRVARLVAEGVPPAAILLLTFTRKASQEMLQRATRLLDSRCERVAGGTCSLLPANLKLRQHGPRWGCPRISPSSTAPMPRT